MWPEMMSKTKIHRISVVGPFLLMSTLVAVSSVSSATQASLSGQGCDSMAEPQPASSFWEILKRCWAGN